MRYSNMQQYEYNIKLKRIYIKEHLVECYDKICRGENINDLIRVHKRFINSMELNGNKINKYKTVGYLEHYRNSKNKLVAMMILTNTLNRINKGETP